MTISKHTFSGCKSLKKIILPNSITEIHDFAFVGCESREEIALPDNLYLIGNGAFSGCKNISIELPNKKLFINCLNIGSPKSFRVRTNNKIYKIKDDVVYDFDMDELIINAEADSPELRVPRAVEVFNPSESVSVPQII